MFSLKRDKKRVELQGRMRRVLDLTSPNLTTVEGGTRAKDRYNRCLPILVAPCENGEACIDRGTLAVTKDLCDHGVSIISCHECPETDVVVGMWPCTPHDEPGTTEPFFFLGRVRQCAEVGAGYWQIGIELAEVVESGKLHAELRPLARKLLPQSLQADCALV